MQIHELNTGTPASSDYLALDTGSDTYKAKPGDIKPAYTSGDDASPSAWTTVTAVAAGLSFSTLINRITTMMKNVRFLYGLLGTTDISAIGNGTVTGALSTLNSKYTTQSVSFTGGSVAAGARKNISVDVSRTGYVAIGVVGINFSSTEVFNIGKFFVSSNAATIVAYNSYTEARDANGTVAVLYEKL